MASTPKPGPDRKKGVVCKTETSCGHERSYRLVGRLKDKGTTRRSAFGQFLDDVVTGFTLPARAFPKASESRSK